DAERDGVVRRLDRDRFAADFDLAAIGLVKSVEDGHQRRFAGAVLADDAADGAALDDEIDVAVGPDGAETLVDADELDCGFSHAACPTLWLISPGQNASMPPFGCQSGAPRRIEGISTNPPWLVNFGEDRRKDRPITGVTHGQRRRPADDAGDPRGGAGEDDRGTVRPDRRAMADHRAAAQEARCADRPLPRAGGAGSAGRAGDETAALVKGGRGGTWSWVVTGAIA